MLEGTYFVRSRGKVSGPFDVEALQKLVKRGVLSRVHELSPDRVSWTGAGEYQELFTSNGSQRNRISALVEEVEDSDGGDSDDIPLAPPPPPSAYAMPHAQSQYVAQAPTYVQPQTVHYATPYQQPQEKGYGGMATAGMVLSLVGLIIFGFILGVLGLIFSSVALAGMSRTGNPNGKGRAITGLVIGIIDVVWGIFLLQLFLAALN